MKAEKPMLIRFSTLGRRWYAFNAYRLNKDGKTLTVTGKKHDVTDQVEQIIANERMTNRRKSVTKRTKFTESHDSAARSVGYEGAGESR